MLIFLAVVPGLFLMYEVYRLDRIEKEPVSLLVRLFLLGAFLATMLAMFLERAGFALLGNLSAGLPEVVIQVIGNFLIVGCAEEGMKYQILRRSTWSHPAFDYRFDGIVYAVAVSLGFAVAENILYVLPTGFLTGLVRMVTAIPGHTVFGIFMGIYYGRAKLLWNRGQDEAAKRMRHKSFLIPVFFHGLYDFLASMGVLSSLFFLVFVIVLDVYALKQIRRESREDMDIELQ